MPIVRARVLFNVTSGTPLFDTVQYVSINCERLSAFSPRPTWLKRYIAPGDGTVITYVPTSNGSDPDIDANTIQGYLIVQGDQTVIVDAAPLAIEDACNACCDGSNVVTPFYTSGQPTFTYPVTSPYCVTRADDGTSYAAERFNLDYIGQTIGSPTFFSHVGTTSKYNVTSYKQPVAVGTDTVAAGACA